MYELTFPPNCGAHLLSGANGKAAQKHSSKRAGERPASWLSWRWVWSQAGSYLAKWNDISPTYINFHEIGEFPFLSYLLRVRSCEVAIIWPDHIQYNYELYDWCGESMARSCNRVAKLWHIRAYSLISRITWKFTNIMESCSIQKRWQLSTFYVYQSNLTECPYLQPLRHGRDSLLARIAPFKLFQNRSCHGMSDKTIKHVTSVQL